MFNSDNSITVNPKFFFPNKCLYYNMLLSQCFKKFPEKKEKINNCEEIIEKMEKFGCFVELNSKPKLFPCYPA